MFRAPLCPLSGARECYTSGCCLWYLVLWFSSCRYVVELRVIPNTTGSNLLYNTLELLMMGIMVPETCWASNKFFNKNHLFHLVGILFPHTNDDARSKSLQIHYHVYKRRPLITILSQRNSIHATPLPYHISLQYNLISSHQCLCCQRSFFFSVFLTERLHFFPSCLMHDTCYTMILIIVLVRKFLQPQYEAVKI